MDDGRNVELMRRAVLELMAQRRIDRVFMPFELAQTVGAYLRSYFGLPGLGFDVTNNFANKYVMKQRYIEADLPTARFGIAYGLGDVPRAANSLAGSPSARSSSLRRGHARRRPENHIHHWLNDPSTARIVHRSGRCRSHNDNWGFTWSSCQARTASKAEPQGRTPSFLALCHANMMMTTVAFPSSHHDKTKECSMETQRPDAGDSASRPHGFGAGGEEPDNQGHQRTGQEDEQAKSWLATQKDRTVQGLGSVGAAMGQASHKLQVSDVAGRASSRIGGGVTSTKNQLTRKAAQFGLSMVGKDVRYLVVGGALVYAGFLTILVAAVDALGLLLPRWLTGFIVGMVTGGVGYFLIQKGQMEKEAIEQ